MELNDLTAGIAVGSWAYFFRTLENKDVSFYSYTYAAEGWKDLLTSYDGQTIEYDAQGNPTSYFGYPVTWEKGRQLKFFCMRNT